MSRVWSRGRAWEEYKKAGEPSVQRLLDRIETHTKGFGSAVTEDAQDGSHSHHPPLKS